MSPRTLLRALIPALLPSVGLFVFGLGVLLGPWSPLVTDGAAARYAAGDLKGAATAWETAANAWMSADARASAAWHAGLVRLQLDDALGAARAMRQSMELEPDRETRATRRRELASLYERRLQDPVRAAEMYELAARDGEASGWLAAGEAWRRAGKADRAWSAYEAAYAELDGDEHEAARATIDARMQTLDVGGVVDAAP